MIFLILFSPGLAVEWLLNHSRAAQHNTELDKGGGGAGRFSWRGWPGLCPAGRLGYKGWPEDVAGLR
ncbi:hypothetical protein AAHA92_09749 [Salvia divinorum]|uniref:Uncharacterized protein n=1 Tax=Salvia divinorum TaxID=28513 RepID=A0ABD1HVY3_SALDI